MIIRTDSDASFCRVNREIEKGAVRFGFIIAFRHTDPRESTGFSILVIRSCHMAALHGIAENQGSGFTLIARSQSYYNANGEFARSYLNEAARLIGIDYDRLVAELDEGGSILWRFVGYVDGSLSSDRDNDDLWQPLWRCLREMSSKKPSLKSVPYWAAVILFEGLQHAAAEGQIVLDK